MTYKRKPEAKYQIRQDLGMAHRSYSEIAAVLADRGDPITKTRVQQICAAAEQKIKRALAGYMEE